MKKVSTGGSRQTMKNDPNKGSVYTIYFIVYTIHTRPCFGDVIGKSHCLQKLYWIKSPEDNNQSLRNVEVRILSKNISSLIHIYNNYTSRLCSNLVSPSFLQILKDHHHQFSLKSMNWRSFVLHKSKNTKELIFWQVIRRLNTNFNQKRDKKN